MANNKLRIIGGRWRSRNISLIESESLRPTPNRVRETLFNWLASYIVGSNCLDAFAGSGALGLEALSRGAASVTFCEAKKNVAAQILKNIEQFQASSTELLMGDFLEQVFSADRKYDIVFLDPPFYKNLILSAVQYLLAKQCLAERAIVYIEVEAQLVELTLPEQWRLLKSGKAGDVKFFLYQTN